MRGQQIIAISMRFYRDTTAPETPPILWLQFTGMGFFFLLALLVPNRAV